MLIVQCDSCGNSVSPETPTDVRIDYTDGTGPGYYRRKGDRFSLCPKCRDRLVDFMRNNYKNAPSMPIVFLESTPAASQPAGTTEEFIDVIAPRIFGRKVRVIFGGDE